ncbi:MAG TPA: hypothetical protein DF699_13565 [Phycisphaerales bacterium]|nr:hypothetical protein [Phycisphaerales bacterium]|tara:strand:- start:108 stop:506 length:399 start_codon:yes stop_codon:yes gene_type:complete
MWKTALFIITALLLLMLVLVALLLVITAKGPRFTENGSQYSIAHLSSHDKVRAVTAVLKNGQRQDVTNLVVADPVQGTLTVPKSEVLNQDTLEAIELQYSKFGMSFTSYSMLTPSHPSPPRFDEGESDNELP